MLSYFQYQTRLEVTNLERLIHDYSDSLPLLLAVQEANGPVGASTLCKNSKLDMSQATIGRQLASLEDAGLLCKVSNKGRILTSHGQEFIRRVNESTSKTQIAEELAALSISDHLDSLTQVLDLRQLLEPYAAEHAAMYASEADIQNIENLAFVHRYKLSCGEPAHKEDLALHLNIARICKNVMLQKVLELLLTENNAYEEFSLAGKAQQDQQIRQHFRILDAIHNHDGEAAKAAMAEHLRMVSLDIKRFFANQECS